MSDEEMLSQEQIDALSQGAELGDIGGGGDAAEGTGGEGGGGGGDLDLAALSSAYQILAEQASTVLSTVLGKEVQVAAQAAAAASEDEIKSSFATDFLQLDVQFNKGLSGQMSFLISKKDTAVLADLMMMGDGQAEYEEDHKDAIGELINQIMGAVSTTFGVQYNMECGVNPAAVGNFDPATTALQLGSSTSAKLDLNVQDVVESSILLVTPNDLSGALGSKASAGGQADAGAGDAGGVETPMDMSGLAEAAAGGGGGMEASQFASFGGAPSAGMQATPAAPGSINMLLDVQLEVAIELGRTQMSIKRILELGPGSIVELDRMAGEPVDLLVNGKVVAKGEVVVVEENFGVRIVYLVSPEERLKSLK